MSSLVISDIHFGQQSLISSYNSLLEPLLTQADTLILLGDTWSFDTNDLAQPLKESQAWMRWASSYVNQVLWMPGNRDARLWYMLNVQPQLLQEHFCSPLIARRGPFLHDGVLLLHGHEHTVYLPNTNNRYVTALIRLIHKMFPQQHVDYTELFFPTDMSKPNLAWLREPSRRGAQASVLVGMPTHPHLGILQYLNDHLPSWMMCPNWFSDTELLDALAYIGDDFGLSSHIIAGHTHRPHPPQIHGRYTITRCGAWRQDDYFDLPIGGCAMIDNGVVTYYAAKT